MILPRRCATCDRPAAALAEWRCPCGRPWRLEPFGSVPPRAALAARPPSLWRYREALPVPDPAVSLGEGGTPLIASRDGRLLFKVESLNPTGSFKDRGAALLLTALRAAGVAEVVEDSSGNAGAAVAAYAARAGLPATIYVPAATSAAKTWQMEAHGARVVRVRGTREDVARKAQAAGATYASHCWDPIFFHGTKTIAFELWEQLDGQVPDWVVSPVGHGTLLLGLALGFQELRRAGRIDRLPRLVAVQSSGCAPLAGPPLDRPPGSGETVAEGIRIRAAVRAEEIREAVRVHQGRWAVVDDPAIEAARRQLGAEGWLVEPTAAVAPAAAGELVASGTIDRDATVVVPLTGHGLKAVRTAG